MGLFNRRRVVCPDWHHPRRWDLAGGLVMSDCKPQKYDTMQLAAIANAVLVAAGSGFKYYEERTQNKIIEALRNVLSQ